MKKIIVELIALIILITAAAPLKVEAISVPDDGVLIVTKCAANEGTQLNKRIKHYKMLPKAIRGAFKARGITITLVSPSEVNDSNKYRGWTYPEQYVVYKNGKHKLKGYANSKIYLVSREQEDASTLLHEAGHIVDNIYKGGWTKSGKTWTLSESKKWQKLYSKYKTTIKDLASTGSKNVYNAREAWAETFMSVCLNPDKVKREAPELYDYTKAVIKSFKKYGSTSIPNSAAKKKQKASEKVRTKKAAVKQETKTIVKHNDAEKAESEFVAAFETTCKQPQKDVAKYVAFDELTMSQDNTTEKETHAVDMTITPDIEEYAAASGTTNTKTIVIICIILVAAIATTIITIIYIKP